MRRNVILTDFPWRLHDRQPSPCNCENRLATLVYDGFTSGPRPSQAWQTTPCHKHGAIARALEPQLRVNLLF